MTVLLVRHGDAVAAGTSGDAPRYLSARGRSETAAVGAQLKAAGLVPKGFVTSPLVRAVQTAEILAAALDYRGVIASDAGLIPEGNADAAARRIEAHAGGVLVVVCHEPIVRGIAAALTGRSSHPPFRTSGAVLFGAGPGARPTLANFEP